MKSFGKFFLLLIIFNNSIELFAQEILWAKKTTELPWSQTSGFLADKWGNIYSVASYSGNLNNPPETFGTVLTKYDKEGNMLFQKKWDSPFYIQDIKYDGENSFYFTGYITGNNIVDGTSLVCNGPSDGILGSLDENGKIQWIKNFGGSQKDQSFGIALNKKDGSLIITGFTENATAEIFISDYDISGNLNWTKSFANFNGEFGENTGREVASDEKGNIYLLFDRKGNHPLDSVNDIAGRYLSKLNAQHEISWSKYINGPSCYYGWECKKLRVNNKEELFLIKYCASKYGGTGELLKQSGTNGNQLSSYGNKCQLGYNDLFVNSNNDYLLAGNEGASICPCETSDPGYQVVKKFSSGGAISWEQRIKNVTITSTAKDNEGNIFIQGNFSSDTAYIGNHMLLKDANSYYAGFLAKIKDGDIPDTQDTLPKPPPATGIAENSSSFKLYPNPGSRDFVFESDHSNTGAIKIYSLAGKEVKLIKFKETLKIKFSLENLNEGIYICKIEDVKGKVIFTEKLVLLK